MDDYWITPGKGKWEDDGNWSGGAPGADDDVYISTNGASVTLSSEVTIGSLALYQSTLKESGSGALDIADTGSLEVEDATLILNGDNDNLLCDITLIDGTVQIGNDGALGAGEIDLEQRSLLGSTITTTISNALVIGSSTDYSIESSTIAAAAHTTLTLSGELAIDGGLLLIGTAKQNGTVVLDSSSVSNTEEPVEVVGGTLKLGNATVAGMFGNQTSSFIFPLTLAGATFDLNGFNVSLSDLYSQGTITNSGALATLTLGPTDSIAGAVDAATAGTMTGNITVAVDSDDPVTYYGSLALTQFGGISLSGTDNMVSGASGDMLTVTGSVSVARGGAVSIDSTSSLFIDGAVNIAAPITLNGSLYTEGGGTITGAVSGDGILAVIDGSQLTLKGAIGTGIQAEVLQGSTLTIGSGGGFSQLIALDGNIVANVDNAVASTGRLLLAGGAFTSTVNGTLACYIGLFTDSTIAAAHGKTLSLTGTIGYENNLDRIIFGSATNDGTVVYDLSIGGSPDNSMETYLGAITVAGGTLRLGAAADDTLFAFSLAVSSGATLDLAGGDVEVLNLAGKGTVLSTSAATLALAGANFGGVISGAISVEVSVIGGGFSPVVALTGANSYTGATEIDTGALLYLGVGGKTGSISSSSIDDDGFLIVDHKNAITISSAISGSGEFEQQGKGTTTLTGANDYSGGTILNHGTLYVADGAELGTGTVTIHGGTLSAAGTDPLGVGNVEIFGGEILYHGDGTLGGALDFQGSCTIAAAHGVALGVTAQFELDGNGTLTFGHGIDDGGILLSGGAPEVDSTMFAIDIAAGIVTLGSDGAASLFEEAQTLTIEANGQLDLEGHGFSVMGITADGAIVNGSTTVADLEIDSGSFGALVDGAIEIDVFGSATFSSTGSFTKLVIETGASATLGFQASEAIDMSGGNGTLILTPTAQLTGAISGITAGDAIDVQGVAYGAGTTLSYNANKHRLKVTDGTHTVTLKLHGSYHPTDFQISNDGSGGTRIAYVGPHAASPHATSPFAGLGADAFAPAAGHAPAAWTAPLHDDALHAHSVGLIG